MHGALLIITLSNIQKLFTFNNLKTPTKQANITTLIFSYVKPYHY